MAFRTQKISQMTPKGADLEATDLIEVSTIESGSYVTRSITGQELIDAIPLPPTGLTVGTTPISSGTIGRVLFQGTGNVLQQSSSLFWDGTNNRLGIGTSTPSVLLEVNGLSIFRDELMISNSGDRGRLTWGGGYFSLQTLGNQGLSLNLTSGTRAMVIPNATGNVLINTTTDAGFKLDVNGTARVSGNFNIATGFELNFNNQNVGLYRSSNNLRLGGFGGIEFLSSATTIASQTIRMTLFSTGNFAINTTTDAGYKLDVNGTARVGNAYLGAWSLGAAYARFGHTSYNSSLPFGFLQEQNGNAYMNGTTSYIGATNNVIFDTNAVEKMRIISNGNILIGTTTDVASSLVTMSSTTKGFLPPRMTTTQKNAIASPATGLMVYDTTLNLISVYNGTTWITL